MSARRGSRLLGLLGPVLVGLLLGLLLLEVAARRAWRPEWQDLTARPPEGMHELPLFDSIDDIDRPEVRGIHHGVPFRTNSQSLRGPEWAREPAKGVFRIAITGDSTTMGSGVEEEDRFSNLLERMLNDAGRKVEVINTGLSGLNSRGAVSRLKRSLRYYDAHLYVYGFSTNDIEGAHYDALGKRPPAEFAANYWERVARAERSPIYLYRFLARWEVVRSAGAEELDPLRHNFTKNLPAWQDFEEGIRQLARMAKQRGVCAHVIIQAHLDGFGADHPWSQIYDLVELTATVNGLGVTQTYPALQGREVDEYWVSLFDPHPNRIAHEIYAQALRDDLLALPEKCWATGPTEKATSKSSSRRSRRRVRRARE